jgi:hypothetical protein
MQLGPGTIRARLARGKPARGMAVEDRGFCLTSPGKRPSRESAVGGTDPRSAGYWRG